MIYSPLVIGNHGQDARHVIPLSPQERCFNEHWLQELIFSFPNILPAGLIFEEYKTLIPLARELSVVSGLIDNLYITSEGKLCLVETKLWRNPEAHRTVIAQIIDYAKDLSLMEYEDLDEKIRHCRERQFGSAEGIMDIIKRKFPKETDDIGIEENIRRCLSTGDFLLLIVGDRIRPEVALLSKTIEATPNLEFTIGLVELQFYYLENDAEWPLIVVPQVVGRTKEVTRGVIRIRYEEKKPEVDISTGSDESKPLSTGKVNMETFLKSVPSDLEEVFRTYLEKWLQGPFLVYWGTVGFSLRATTKQGKYKTIIDAYPEQISIFKKDWLKDWGNPVELYKKYREKVDKVSAVLQVISSGRRYVPYSNMKVEDLVAMLEATDELANALFLTADNEVHDAD